MRFGMEAQTHHGLRPFPPVGIEIKVRNASALSDVGLKNTYKIGHLERGRVGMGCVLNIVTGVLASIKRGNVEKVRAFRA